jgi:hypothetical protein
VPVQKFFSFRTLGLWPLWVNFCIYC